MTWKIIFEDNVLKTLKKFDKPNAKRIIDFIENRLAVAQDPRLIGAALQGSSLGAFWKYRIGDYRLIAKIDDEVITITVVKIGHRKEVYR